MTDLNLGRLAMCVIPMVGAALSVGKAAGQAGGPKSAVDALTGVSRSAEHFDIADPGARVSDAMRLNDDLVSKEGVIPPPTPGFRFTSRVVLRTADAALAGAMGAKPLTGVPGFWTVDMSSVAQAIDTAWTLAATPGIAEAYVDVARPRSLRSPSDPSYVLQWHLRNLADPGIDIGAEDAWAMGYTGAGQLVGVIEGGFQTDHPDLAANYSTESSMTGGASTTHATSVAGLIAAVANNGKGGVGVAYNAKLSKLVYGTPVNNAEAFTWRNDIHGVKNNSWGPTDNGNVWPITSVEREALAQSAAGRDGLGTVIVWAGGNGAYFEEDRADYDPFASSRFAICVGALDDDDGVAYYSEPGSCLLVVAHSSGGPGGGDRQIFTTSGASSYTSTFGGTSTAAPLTAGVVALMLEANPALTWRDVQHVLVNSARLCDPTPSRWATNATGRNVSYEYGFGAVSAPAAVELATRWHSLPPERSSTSGTVAVNAPIPDGDRTVVARSVPIHDNFVVEAVELVLNVQTTFIGDLDISLTSPSGTESILAVERDDPTDHYAGTVFTTRRPWGERANGNWTVRISDGIVGDPAIWQDLEIRVHGYCPADVNRDQETDILDFLDFIESFGPCNGVRAPCYGIGGVGADYNRDATIDVLDMLDFIDDLSNGC